MLRPVEVTLSFVPEFARRTRRAWAHLGRPVTIPASTAEWRRVIEAMGPVEGPFDWALCMGPHHVPGRARLSELGNLVEAWRGYEDAEAQTALSRLADELMQRAQAELDFDFITELPSGYESGKPHTLAELISHQDQACTDFWDCRCASSYATLPEPGGHADLALGLKVPVTGKKILLTTLVHDRPDLASACVHRLRTCGAGWVGLLALSSETALG